jgi:hypothetical protein
MNRRKTISLRMAAIHPCLYIRNREAYFWTPYLRIPEAKSFVAIVPLCRNSFTTHWRMPSVRVQMVLQLSRRIVISHDKLVEAAWLASFGACHY